jgi:hypothetical protein
MERFYCQPFGLRDHASGGRDPGGSRRGQGLTGCGRVNSEGDENE